MGQLGQDHRAYRVVLAETPPLQEAVEHAQRRQGTGKAAAADVRTAPRGKERAHIPRRQSEQLRHVRQAIEVPSEESKELADVAGVGLGRVVRELALDRDVVEPVLDRLANVRRPHKSRRFDRSCHACDPPFDPRATRRARLN